MVYTPNYSHLVGIMIINHWVWGYTIFRHTHMLLLYFYHFLSNCPPVSRAWSPSWVLWCSCWQVDSRLILQGLPSCPHVLHDASPSQRWTTLTTGVVAQDAPPPSQKVYLWNTSEVGHRATFLVRVWLSGVHPERPWKSAGYDYILYCFFFIHINYIYIH